MNFKSIVILLAALLAATALTGCASNDDGDANDNANPTPPTNTTDETPETNETPEEEQPLPGVNETVDNVTGYTLTTSGIPTIVTAGNNFTFKLNVVGPIAESDHIGAHYANEELATPSASTMKACAHTAGQLPGQFDVTCTLEGGEWYVYGHLRTMGEDNHTHDYWAAPVKVVAYEYALVLENVTSSGKNATFSLNVTGSPASNSTHAGAHYTTEPVTGTFSTSTMQACSHGDQSAPGNFTVACEFASAGTYYVYGHYRVNSGDDVEDFWSSAVVYTVA